MKLTVLTQYWLFAIALFAVGGSLNAALGKTAVDGVALECLAAPELAESGAELDLHGMLGPVWSNWLPARGTARSRRAAVQPLRSWRIPIRAPPRSGAGDSAPPSRPALP